VHLRWLDLGPRSHADCVPTDWQWLAYPMELRGDGAFIFDRQGAVYAACVRAPRLSSALDFPNFSIEVCAEPGLLILHDRWETYVAEESADGTDIGESTKGRRSDTG
jgi:hypothetical protein